jgi:hypothetical protein
MEKGTKGRNGGEGRKDGLSFVVRYCRDPGPLTDLGERCCIAWIKYPLHEASNTKTPESQELGVCETYYKTDNLTSIVADNLPLFTPSFPVFSCPSSKPLLQTFPCYCTL